MDECAQSPGPCKNGGTCHNQRGGYQCICVLGWSGQDCSLNIDDCATFPCYNGGTCIDRIGYYQCQCPDDKTGKYLPLRIGLFSTSEYCRFFRVNPLTAKLFNLNFHPLEVVSRWRDPQLQVRENYSCLTKWRSTLFKSCWLMSLFIFNIFKMWYLMC